MPKNSISSPNILNSTAVGFVYVWKKKNNKGKFQREHVLHGIEDNDTSSMRGNDLQTKEDKNERGRSGKSRATGESKGWRQINRVMYNGERLKTR